jgi:hypothetical protein
MRAGDSWSLHHQPNSVLAVPALDDPPIPIGATVTVHYDNREIEGELLGIALGRDAAYVRIAVGEIRHRIILVPWSTIRRKRQ